MLLYGCLPERQQWEQGGSGRDNARSSVDDIEEDEVIDVDADQVHCIPACHVHSYCFADKHSHEYMQNRASCLQSKPSKSLLCSCSVTAVSLRLWHYSILETSHTY